MHARRGPRWPVMLAAALCTVWVAQPVAAHLMEDQQGTLNIVGQRGYLVLSLPVSALSGADEDGDGLLSGAELQRRAPAIERDLRERVRVSDAGVTVPLDGVLLNLSPDAAHREVAATHVVLLAVAMFPRPPVRLQVTLRVYGRSAGERAFRFTATRRDAAGQLQTEVVRFTPDVPQHGFFASKAGAKPPKR